MKGIVRDWVFGWLDSFLLPSKSVWGIAKMLCLLKL